VRRASVPVLAIPERRRGSLLQSVEAFGAPATELCQPSAACGSLQSSMLDTPVAVLAALALLMPGFVIAELALAGSARGPRGDLEIALRSLAYTLVIHLVFAWWTAMLVRHIGPEHNWVHHVWAIVLYVAVVLVIVPVIAGTALNRYLAGVEHRHRQPGAWKRCAPWQRIRTASGRWGRSSNRSGACTCQPRR
jgi:uncharacterized membrane protein YidH (DUF202 family)